MRYLPILISSILLAFAAMAQDAETEAAEADVAEEGPAAEDEAAPEEELVDYDETGLDEEPEETPAPVGESVLPMADLPRGARFGTLVHHVFEQVPFNAPDLEGAIREAVNLTTGAPFSGVGPDSPLWADAKKKAAELVSAGQIDQETALIVIGGRCGFHHARPGVVDVERPVAAG